MTAVQVGADDLSAAIANPDKSVTLKAGRNANLKVMLEKGMVCTTCKARLYL